MNIVKSSLLVAPVLAVAAAFAWAQPAVSQDAAPPEHGGPERGGNVTMDQFVARQMARLMAADTDGDGRISRAEMAAVAGMSRGNGANRGGHDPERRFDAMDTNHDGYLDKDEIRIALEQRFHRMDLNGDGILTPEERMAGRAHRNQSDPASMRPAAQP